MPKSDGLKNLKRPTAEEARKLGSAGGKASGAARQKKKLMSIIYGEFLAEKFDVKLTPWDPKSKATSFTGESLVNYVVKNVLLAGGPPAVSLMKEIREAIEGNKMALTDLDGVLLSPTEREARIAEILAKAKA
jgi:hypothetical protein